MKRLISTLGGPQMGLLKNRLEDEGIECELRDEQMSQAIHSAAFPVELWILDDEDYPEAVGLLNTWRGPASETSSSWTCPECGEALGAQFDTCWKCGLKREFPSPMRN